MSASVNSTTVSDHSVWLPYVEDFATKCVEHKEQHDSFIRDLDCLVYFAEHTEPQVSAFMVIRGKTSDEIKEILKAEPYNAHGLIKGEACIQKISGFFGKGHRIPAPICEPCEGELKTATCACDMGVCSPTCKCEGEDADKKQSDDTATTGGGVKRPLEEDNEPETAGSSEGVECTKKQKTTEEPESTTTTTEA